MQWMHFNLWLKHILLNINNNLMIFIIMSPKTASSVARWLRVPVQCMRPRRCGFEPWVGRIPWRRKWQPTSVFFMGKYHGQRSLAGYGPWIWKELDTTEMTECTHVSPKIPSKFIFHLSLNPTKHYHNPSPSLLWRQTMWKGNGLFKKVVEVRGTYLCLREYFRRKYVLQFPTVTRREQTSLSASVKSVLLSMCVS